jgi:hypothetical protein
MTRGIHTGTAERPPRKRQNARASSLFPLFLCSLCVIFFARCARAESRTPRSRASARAHTALARRRKKTKGACPSLRTLLGFRLVCGAWATVVPPIAMDLFPRARLVVPRDVLPHCSPAVLARTLRAFRYARNPEPIELSVGRSEACYPGPLAVSAIADSPDIAAVSVVLGRSRGTVTLAHLRGTLARLLGKV